MIEEEFSKCPICNSTDGYESSGIIGKYAQCLKCMTKWRLFMKDNRLLELKLHELPKNGRAVHTITTTKAPLFTIIGKRLPTGFWKNLKLDKEISWEFLSKSISSDVSKAVFAEKGEKLLYQWEGTREVHEETIISGKPYKFVKPEQGILLLSTRKLRWLRRREHGVWKKATSFLVVYEIPLQEVRGVSGETGDSTDWEFSPGRVKNVSIVDKQDENKFKLHEAFLEILQPLIEKTIEIRRKELKAEKKKERLHVMLDFSFLKTYMQKGGLVMQVLRCPHCSATVEFPTSGTQTKCSHCGSTIYAQDIFEKVKALLE